MRLDWPISATVFQMTAAITSAPPIRAWSPGYSCSVGQTHTQIGARIDLQQAEQDRFAGGNEARAGGEQDEADAELAGAEQEQQRKLRSVDRGGVPIVPPTATSQNADRQVAGVMRTWLKRRTRTVASAKQIMITSDKAMPRKSPPRRLDRTR